MRDYADKLTDALGEGFDSETAHQYAGGAFPLKHLVAREEGDDGTAAWARNRWKMLKRTRATAARIESMRRKIVARVLKLQARRNARRQTNFSK